MNNYDRAGKAPNYHQMNPENPMMDPGSCSESKRIESDKYGNEEAFQRMQRQAEEELENAKRTFMSTENVVKQSRTGSRPCVNPGNKLIKRPSSKPCMSVQPPPCKQNPATRRREAIQHLSKVPDGKECPFSDPRTKGRSGVRDVLGFTQKMGADNLAGSSGGIGNERRELPKKPHLTSEQLCELLKQEAHDIESARILTSDVRESYKKPCPKQQKARDAAKAVMEPKKEEPSVPCIPLTIIKEPAPLVDPDPEDMPPEVAANMMYMQERGVKMISCPEETVKLLFSDQFPDEDIKTEGKKERAGDENKQGTPEEVTEGVDDSVFTRNMTQTESDEEEKASSKYYDAWTKLNERKREFFLQEKVSRCTNRVQLRGNVPSWFPGYFVAFPDQVGDKTIQLAKSPSEILKRAWMAAKPSHIRPTDVYLVE